MTDPIKAITGRIRRRCGSLADLSLEQGISDPWQSLLFDGGRHHIALRLDGERIDEAIVALQDEVGVPDFVIPGHLVAEISVAAIDRCADHALIKLDAVTIRN
ncbi:hypothetical protein [Sphingomonas sp. SRS2]|uniref:hypothetical protein n=1 Tax=Sphingomonas sp. SRS2 TaxID=133190 RepID=UPI00061846B4|nr:hypothetical protein [Sphingomonas sp. SRS2]KKC27412.1 hypothetical protein WP12_03230 [Sphingomonas sp. SRS2]